MADIAPMKTYAGKPAYPAMTAKPKVSPRPPSIAQMQPKGGPNPIELAQVMKSVAAATSAGRAFGARKAAQSK